MEIQVGASEPAHSRWPAWLRGVRAAVVVLTRLPAGGFPYSDDDWRWSAAHLPLVGAVVGALLAGVWTASARAGHFVGAVLVVGASLLLTGAMHEDGLADTADALGGGTTRERVLAILKDSRIGTYGAAAIAVSLLLRVALLERLGAAAGGALVVAGAVSRLVPVWLMGSLPYVTDPATAKSRSVVATTRAQMLVAMAWVGLVATGLVAAGVVKGGEMLAILLAGASIGFGARAWFQARVAGITGDFLGAAQQVAECATLLVLVFARGEAP